MTPEREWANDLKPFAHSWWWLARLGEEGVFASAAAAGCEVPAVLEPHVGPVGDDAARGSRDSGDVAVVAQEPGRVRERIVGVAGEPAVVRGGVGERRRQLA